MKKVTIMIFAGLLLASCGNEAAAEKAAEEAKALEVMTSEINTMDSISSVLDESAQEIEAVSDELNELLNEL